MFNFFKSIKKKSFLNSIIADSKPILKPVEANPVDSSPQEKEVPSYSHQTKPIAEDMTASDKFSSLSTETVNTVDVTNYYTESKASNVSSLTDLSLMPSSPSAEEFKDIGGATGQTRFFFPITDFPEDTHLSDWVCPPREMEDYIPGQAVEQRVITLDEITNTDIELIKDLIVASRTGYLDYSTLKFFGYVDSKGYVKNSDALYDSWLLQTKIPNLENANFSDAEVAWGQENFEIIRVLESNSRPFSAMPYEVNLSLLKDVDTGDYLISIGGTNPYGYSDWFTNLANCVFRETPHFKKESELIDQLFREDIEEGATVNILGHSLGGTEAMLQYYRTPDAYENVYALQPQALDGLRGIIQSQFNWDGTGDDKITAILSDEKTIDFNDFVTKNGHVPAGTIYDVTVEDKGIGLFNDFFESHMLADIWNNFA